RYIGWFVGLAPADDPRVAIAVAIDEPTGVHTGGAVAAPVFARVAAAHLTQLGIPTGAALRPPAAAATRSAAAPASARGAVAAQGDRGLDPAPRGRTVAEVVQRTARTARRVELTGSGRVVAQEPDPGRIVTAGRER